LLWRACWLVGRRRCRRRRCRRCHRRRRACKCRGGSWRGSCAGRARCPSRLRRGRRRRRRDCLRPRPRPEPLKDPTRTRIRRGSRRLAQCPARSVPVPRCCCCPPCPPWRGAPRPSSSSRRRCLCCHGRMLPRQPRESLRGVTRSLSAGRCRCRSRWCRRCSAQARARAGDGGRWRAVCSRAT
jgi:hypothetical protein